MEVRVMATAEYPRVMADDKGVWVLDGPAKRSGIAWDEIYIVSGVKVDCMTRVLTMLALDWDWGEYLEFNEEMAGFDDVVRAMTSRLAGIRADWIDRIRSLKPGDERVEVWK